MPIADVQCMSRCCTPTRVCIIITDIQLADNTSHGELNAIHTILVSLILILNISCFVSRKSMSVPQCHVLSLKVLCPTRTLPITRLYSLFQWGPILWPTQIAISSTKYVWHGTKLALLYRIKYMLAAPKPGSLHQSRKIF